MKNPKFSKLVMYIFLIIGFIVICISGSVYGVDPPNFTFYIGCSVMFLSILYGVIFVRCPACGCMLPLRGCIGDYCHKCGTKL